MTFGCRPPFGEAKSIVGGRGGKMFKNGRVICQGQCGRWTKEGAPKGSKKPKRCGVRINTVEEEDAGEWEITRTPEEGEAKTEKFNVR